MTNEYQPSQFEPKWQQYWDQQYLYRAEDFSTKPKQYILVEFPYPSGDGLHVGHCLSYTAQDILARYLRMKGNNVLYPMGWDAFGLPAENYAIKNKIHPRQAVEKNIANFKRQIKSLGISFDWSREVNTTDPKYYKWTQWIFLQLYKAGLAEKKLTKINWCPKDKIGLAFEEVVDGKCERCGTEVELRDINQWILKITKYADRLVDDLETVNFLPHIKKQQIDWIGRSKGVEIEFKIAGSAIGDPSTQSQVPSPALRVFTTRPDTIFGATFLVIAPEHPLIQELEVGSKGMGQIKNGDEIKEYVMASRKLTDRERQEKKDKTGVELKGVKALHPFTQEELPIFVADYVMMGYGTGAIMAVPAHDERDWDFAKQKNLPIRHVISGGDEQSVYSGDGSMMNSHEFDGLPSTRAWQTIADALVAKKQGTITTHYKLRDWIFSRQHYWGEPIPIIICQHCGYVPLEDKDLPLELPDVAHYEPTDTGDSPLAAISDWVNVSCPKCGAAAKRETDTMPNWAGSSWYFLRFTDPLNDQVLADKKKLDYWLPVDLYNGGMEHTTLHLLYSRFWHKFLYDQGLVPTVEPYARRVSHGMILGPDSQKMSKSRGNVINPDAIVEQYGADTLRLYEMFMGEYDGTKIWNDGSVQGVYRFLKRVWDYYQTLEFTDAAQTDISSLLHQTIKKVDDDINRRSYNTLVSGLMILFKAITEQKITERKALETFLLLLAPLAPHITEEIWREKMGHQESIHLQAWPTYDPALLRSSQMILPIQINGKVRGQVEVEADITEADLKPIVLSLPVVQKHLNGTEPKKFIYVAGKIVNIVL